MATRIPWELIEHTLHFLKTPADLPALRACSLISHSCSVLMRPKIFHTIIIASSRAQMKGNETARKFLTLLETSPQIAQFVKSLALSEVIPGVLTKIGFLKTRRWIHDDASVVIKILSLTTELNTVKLLFGNIIWFNLKEELTQALGNLLNRPSIQTVWLAGIHHAPRWLCQVLKQKRHLMVSTITMTSANWTGRWTPTPSTVHNYPGVESLIVGPHILVGNDPQLRILPQLVQRPTVTSSIRSLDLAVDGGEHSREDLPELLSSCSASLERLSLQLVRCSEYDVMCMQRTPDLNSLIDLTNFPNLHTIGVSVPICAPGCTAEEHASDQLLTILHSLETTLPSKPTPFLKLELTIGLDSQAPVLQLTHVHPELVWSWERLDSHLASLLWSGVQEIDIKILDDPEGPRVKEADLRGMVLMLHLPRTSTSGEGRVRISKASQLPCWDPEFGSVV